MLRFMAILFGVAFIFAGVAGFMPAFTTNGALLGIFEVNTKHNIVHITSGVLAIMAATSFKYTKLYFLLLGLAYSITAVLGFARGGDLFMMHVNMADNFLHLGVGAVALLLWYYASKKQA